MTGSFNRTLTGHAPSIRRVLLWSIVIALGCAAITLGVVGFGREYLSSHGMLLVLLSFILLASLAAGTRIAAAALVACAVIMLYWQKLALRDADPFDQAMSLALFLGIGSLFIVIVEWRRNAVSRLHQTTTALRDSEIRFHALADVGQDILMTTSPDGAADYLNQHFYDYTSLSHTQSLGWGWLSAVHPQDVHGVRERWREALERRAPFETSCRLRSASSAFRWFVCRFSPMTRPDGSISRWFGVCTDIDELRHSEERYRVIFELSAVGQAQMDPITGRFMRVNRRLCDLTGYSEAELLATSFLHLVCVNDRNDAFAGFRRVVDGELTEFNAEHRFLRKDGRLQWVNITTTLLRDADHCPHLAMSIITDIGERKRIEAELGRHREHLELEIQRRSDALEQSHHQLRLRERLASIGTLAGGIGHDLGNLVLPILCRLDSLAERDLPQQVLNEIDSVRKACVHLRRLSSGLRMLAMDPNENQAAGDTASVPTLWQNVELIIRRSLPKNVPLECDIPADLPDVTAAPHHLTHALLNLVTNAGEATNSGGRVKIWAKSSPDGLAVQLAVSDNGCGMPPEVCKRALEPFFTTKHRSLSTGLGLSQVHGFCKAVGGSLDIFSAPGEGTTVLMSLPVVGKHSNASDFGSTRPLARVTIDDARMARYSKALLETSGYQVVMDSPDWDSQASAAEPSLWLVSPQLRGREEISQFINRKPEHRVILVGSPDWPVDDPAVFVVDGTHRAMRSALRDVGKRSSDMSTRGVTQ